ncbi:ankyrin repeat domain-containing protein [Leptolyngbyaceae cyanobacterium UHCC 1019]
MARKLVSMSSAMESAVSSKSIPSILSLLEQGESIDVCQRATGVSLLMCVIREGLTDLACQLIERGADIEARSAEGETALMEAAIVGNTDLVKFLLDRGAKPNRRSRSGWTAMLWAEINGFQEIVEMLQRADGRFS